MKQDLGMKDAQGLKEALPWMKQALPFCPQEHSHLCLRPVALTLQRTCLSPENSVQLCNFVRKGLSCLGPRQEEEICAIVDTFFPLSCTLLERNIKF